MKRHYLSLDALRGVAALAVLGSHFENLSGISLHLQRSGVAVDFFFILSGFVIGQAYERRLAEGLTWRAYMILRLKRLYPAIFGALVIGLTVALAAGEPASPATALQWLLLPVLIGPAMHGGELFPLNGPQWSLLLELAANAAHAAVSRWLTTPRLAAFAVLAGLALIPVSLHFGGLDVGWARQNGWAGVPRVAFGFSAGLLIWRLHEAGLRAPPVPFALVALALVACLVRPWPQYGAYALADLALVLFALPALVVMAVASPVPAPAQRLCAWLGALSYPLYAVHAPLLRAFEAVLDPLSPEIEAVGWALALPVVIALASLFERAFDSPVRAWLKSPGAAGRRRRS